MTGALLLSPKFLKSPINAVVNYECVLQVVFSGPNCLVELRNLKANELWSEVVLDGFCQKLISRRVVFL